MHRALSKTFGLAIGLLPVLVALWAAPARGDVSVNFDGTGAPCCFPQTTPLTSLYAPLGITFQGVDGSGGSILNQSGGFGFNALSGTDFLGFFTGAGTGVVEDVTFSSSLSSLATGVSIWAASDQQGTFTISAFDSSSNLLGTSSAAASTSWTQLAINAAGISSVRLSGSGLSSFGYDDLNVMTATATAPVPEPEIYAMMGLGLGFLGWIGRRRKPGSA